MALFEVDHLNVDSLKCLSKHAVGFLFLDSCFQRYDFLLQSYRNKLFKKYFAAVCLVVISLIPTLLYYFTIYKLGATPGNLDSGATWGSYIGLVLLSSSFVSIGLFASSITDNQIVAFILAAFLCFVAYVSFNALSGLGLFGGTVDDIIESIGIQYHYNSISRGVVDSRDVLYFLSLIVIFILSTKTCLESRKW